MCYLDYAYNFHLALILTLHLKEMMIKKTKKKHVPILSIIFIQIILAAAVWPLTTRGGGRHTGMAGPAPVPVTSRGASPRLPFGVVGVARSLSGRSSRARDSRRDCGRPTTGAIVFGGRTEYWQHMPGFSATKHPLGPSESQPIMDFTDGFGLQAFGYVFWEISEMFRALTQGYRGLIVPRRGSLSTI